MSLLSILHEAPLLLLEAERQKHKMIQLTLVLKIPQATQVSIGKAKGPSPAVTKGS